MFKYAQNTQETFFLAAYDLQPCPNWHNFIRYTTVEIEASIQAEQNL